MRRLVLLLLFVCPMPLLACEVMLSNASDVDLGLVVSGRHIVLGPGQAQRVPFSALADVEFGAVSHEFQLEAARDALCGSGAAINLEARQDGSLWLRQGVQPKGLPLRPISRQDLTAAPPNNAFKPKLHRYANNMAGRACHVVSYALQFGLT
jgi:hypothetical protein